MLLPDYTETGLVYHIVDIVDLRNILKNGIKYDDKNTYETKYVEFHKFMDDFKPDNIPHWVMRQRAIFCSMNFGTFNTWHSHSVLLGVKIDIDNAWIANENLANEIYEPFILKDIDGFKYCKNYIDEIGMENIKTYWDTSLSFKENLKLRKDKSKGYDEEVLILGDIPAENIYPIAIVTDHRIINIDQCKDVYS
ncbi:hypothetical protein [Clostridiisalibacter paucivorans]|uniref:hypothetical protein n=1 Tax=Clostridiisalibacter paucivorans TaxID=408753 RepID=UPI00047B2621|nr:hypothetical protein [Clostridiisalibacter paucivorans]